VESKGVFEILIKTQDETYVSATLRSCGGNVEIVVNCPEHFHQDSEDNGDENSNDAQHGSKKHIMEIISESFLNSAVFHRQIRSLNHGEHIIGVSFSTSEFKKEEWLKRICFSVHVKQQKKREEELEKKLRKQGRRVA
jgi:hypothetical protein